MEPIIRIMNNIRAAQNATNMQSTSVNPATLDLLVNQELETCHDYNETLNYVEENNTDYILGVFWYSFITEKKIGHITPDWESILNGWLI